MSREAILWPGAMQGAGRLGRRGILAPTLAGQPTDLGAGTGRIPHPLRGGPTEALRRWGEKTRGPALGAVHDIPSPIMPGEHALGRLPTKEPGERALGRLPTKEVRGHAHRWPWRDSAVAIKVGARGDRNSAGPSEEGPA